MASLQPKAGFDWARVTWGRLDSPRSVLCSYCSASIGEDSVPLMVWKNDGHCAQFCDACMARWFGMTRYEGADAERDDG